LCFIFFLVNIERPVLSAHIGDVGARARGRDPVQEQGGHQPVHNHRRSARDGLRPGAHARENPGVQHSRQIRLPGRQQLTKYTDTTEN
jgi:hypothetical protein